MKAKEWLEVLEQAEGYNKHLTPLIINYGEMLIEEQKVIPLDADVKSEIASIDDKFLQGLHFIKCDKKYYRTKLYDNTFLEIDIEDSFASLVKLEKLPTWENEQITKICLPNKLTKERLLKLLEVIR